MYRFMSKHSSVDYVLSLSRSLFTPHHVNESLRKTKHYVFMSSHDDHAMVRRSGHPRRGRVRSLKDKRYFSRAIPPSSLDPRTVGIYRHYVPAALLSFRYPSIFLNPDYVAACSLRSLRSNYSSFYG